jgi:antitoxin (DNA-binding transcriptional repressor) of toxin-antitoxin stability system
MDVKKDTPKRRLRMPKTSVGSTNLKAVKSVSIRALRTDWRRVKAMVARGAKVVVTDNGVPIMQLVPLEQPVGAEIDWLAHLEKIQAIAGGKTTGGNAVLEERASYKS